MSTPTAALRAGIDYVRRNPFALLTAAREAARLRITVPLDLVRWGFSKISSDKVGEFTAVGDPPGLALGMVVKVMGSKLGVRAVVTIDEIVAGPDLLRVSLRLRDLTVRPIDGAAGGPIQALLASGAIDLKKPGNLVGFLPKRPAMLVEAADDRFVLDLMKVDKLASNQRLQRILGLITPVVSIRDVETRGDDLLIGLRVRPTGLPMALAALRM